MSMERVKYLIVGGGVTGLSFASFIGTDDYTIVEREESLGGYCRTIYKDGFVWDYSGHFFHFQDSFIRDYLLKKMPAESVFEVVRHAKIFYNGELVDFPFQRNIHQLTKCEFIDCLYDLYFRSENREHDSFKRMVYARFGRSIAEKFLIPYNEKLYACDLDSLDVDAMGRFFPHATMDDIIRNFKLPDSRSYNSTFIYPKKGAVQFVEALGQDLDSSRIFTNEEVRNIFVEDKLVETSHRRIAYEYLISTIPFPRLMKLTSWQGDLSSLSWNKVLVFNMGFDSKGPEGTHWIYFPEKKYGFYRVGFYDNIFSSQRMSLYLEIGLKRGQHVNQKEELEAVLNNLENVRILEHQRLLAFEAVVLDPAYVHITKESKQLFKRVDYSLRSAGVYSIGRYGGWKYCSIEDNILEAKALAESFNRMRTDFSHETNHAS